MPWPATANWPAPGDRVRACYLSSAPASKRRLLSKKLRTGAGRWFSGTVLVRHPDGRCDVLYDCGAMEALVAPSSIAGGAPAVASATNAAGEAADGEAGEPCVALDESDDDDLRSLHTEAANGPASFASTRSLAEPFCSDPDSPGEWTGGLHWFADVCARASAAAEPRPRVHAPEPLKLAKGGAPLCVAGECLLRRPALLELCGERRRRVKPRAVKAKCIEQECKQMRRYESGRCRLCERRAAINPHLPRCIEPGCNRRLFARAHAPRTERCATCERLATARD